MTGEICFRLKKTQLKIVLSCKRSTYFFNAANGDGLKIADEITNIFDFTEYTRRSTNLVRSLIPTGNMFTNNVEKIENFRNFKI